MGSSSLLAVGHDCLHTTHKPLEQRCRIFPLIHGECICPAGGSAGAAEVERVIVTASNIPKPRAGANSGDTYRPADREKLGDSKATDLPTFLPQSPVVRYLNSGKGAGVTVLCVRSPTCASLPKDTLILIDVNVSPLVR